jgi:hypothetical protein
LVIIFKEIDTKETHSVIIPAFLADILKNKIRNALSKITLLGFLNCFKEIRKKNE